MPKIELKWPTRGIVCLDCNTDIKSTPRELRCSACIKERHRKETLKANGSSFTGRLGVTCARCKNPIVNRPKATYCAECAPKAAWEKTKAWERRNRSSGKPRTCDICDVVIACNASLCDECCGPEVLKNRMHNRKHLARIRARKEKSHAAKQPSEST